MPSWYDSTQTKLAIKPCPTTLLLAKLSWEVLPPGSKCRKYTLNSPMQLIIRFCHWLSHIYTLVVSRYDRLLSSPTSTFWLCLYAQQNIPTKSKLKQSLPPAVLKHAMFDSWSLCLLKIAWRAKNTRIFILYLYSVCFRWALTQAPPIPCHTTRGTDDTNSRFVMSQNVVWKVYEAVIPVFTVLAFCVWTSCCCCCCCTWYICIYDTII